MNLNPYQVPYASHGASIDPYSGSAASSLGPDYSYASAQSVYGMVPPPGGHQISQHTSFEYGGGQKLTPSSLVSHSPAASAYYDVGHGRSAGALTSNTSSKDPKLLRSRVFIGNLNTSIVSRDQVHQIFAPFGEILAISMHKGYAFVQYATETEARNAVTFTDGSLLGGKNIDVTISSEPKSSKTADISGTKRSADVGNSGFDYKKPRISSMPSSLLKIPTTVNNSVLTTLTSGVTHGGNGSVMDNATKQELLAKGEDILICGRCRQLFTMLSSFNDHKSKCGGANGGKGKEENGSSTCGNKEGKPEGEPVKVQCFICHMPFDFSWHLLQHMSQVHSMTVFEAASVKEEN